MINKWARGKVILNKRIFFGNGEPKFHYIPTLITWGPFLSIFWLDIELIFRRAGKNIQNSKWEAVFKIQLLSFIP